jgi:orotidine-5'-phosphate decarboxylase
MVHFADRLADAVRQKGNPLCVGLDPRWESLPASLQSRYGPPPAGAASAFEEFCSRILDIVAPIAPVVKPQSAFFELCGPAGLVALQNVLRKAARLGLVTILDSKRGDIASTAAAYADAAFGGMPLGETVFPIWNVDSLTVNPYLGRDAVEPFIQAGRKHGRGLFVLVRTSNPGAAMFQDLNCGGVPLHEKVGAAVASWARENIGQCGFGDVGAVVGATHPAELQKLRAMFPEVWFLVPGYGAQGASAADVAGAFRADGLGAIVNSSRGVTFPFRRDDPAWEAAIENAARAAATELAAVQCKARA